MYLFPSVHPLKQPPSVFQFLFNYILLFLSFLDIYHILLISGLGNQVSNTANMQAGFTEPRIFPDSPHAIYSGLGMEPLTYAQAGSVSSQI